MQPSIIPADEPQRLAALRRYDILDTPPDGMFDRLTALAARRFNVPISIISLVDHDRIWFKSGHGVPVKQIGREPGLCASAILQDKPWILSDARSDVRALANPLVAGDFGLRFYAGVPLRTRDGYNLGTLCIIDKEARPIDQAEIDDLKDLASVVMDQMELRLEARSAVSHAEMMAREIDHRVMNSLQFISGLLNMQSRVLGITDTAAQLQIASNRVSAVARIHRHFYSEHASESVSCLRFLQRLCAELADVLEKPIEVEGDEGNVRSVRIQPIGLIVNELVTNAAKHGAGKIHVAYRNDGDQHSLIVCDEGPGLAPGFEPTKVGQGLGMRVVGVLAKQLDGSLKAGPNPSGRGACFTVTFPD